MRKLFDAGVEGDGQAAGGIVLAAEGFGDGCASLFAGVPGFEDCVGVVFGPVDAEGAAVHEHDDQRLAGGRHCFEQFLLGLGQIEAGAIATFEAFFADGHLFAFEFAGDANDGYDDVRVFCGGDGFSRWLHVDLGPDELRCRGVALRQDVFNFQFVGLALFEVDSSEFGLGAAGDEGHAEDSAVECGTVEVFAAEAEVVVAGLGGGEGGFGLDDDGFFAFDL